MDFKDIREIMRLFDKSSIAEFEIETEDARLYLSKSAPADYNLIPQQVPQLPAQVQQNILPQSTLQTPVIQTPPALSVEESGTVIDSPMIGTYYNAPSPGAEPFVKVGEIVEKGQTLCIIEAMKIMNAIEAEYRCRIKKMFIENGKPVEYGQDLFLVEPL